MTGFKYCLQNVRNVLKKYGKESVRTGAIMGTGDLLAQTLFNDSPPSSIQDIDTKRTLKFATIGVCLVAPTLKTWYTFLDKNIPIEQNRVLVAATKKMLLDQGIMAPILSMLIMVTVELMDRKSWPQIKERVSNQYPQMMKANYLLWPAVQMINFGLVPLAYQVLFVQLVAVCWNCFLSQLFYKKDETTPPTN